MPVLLPVDAFARYLVDEVTACWNWTRPFNEDGYGQITAQIIDNGPRRNTSIKAHVLFFVDAVCKVPPGFMLDHKCRNRKCVNYQHLEIVTNAENVRRGNSAKLDLAKVAEIRSRYAGGGVSQFSLAGEYGVSEATVHGVVTGRSWTVDIENPLLSLSNRVGRRPVLDAISTRSLIQDLSTGESQSSIARRYGVSPGTVTNLKHRHQKEQI